MRWVFGFRALPAPELQHSPQLKKISLESLGEASVVGRVNVGFQPKDLVNFTRMVGEWSLMHAYNRNV